MGDMIMSIEEAKRLEMVFKLGSGPRIAGIKAMHKKRGLI
jgi:hypothetical protein